MPDVAKAFASRPGDWGRKALLVFALAFLMAIPGLFVFALVSERATRAEKVGVEVSQLQGGPQQVLGPMIVAPYAAPASGGDGAVSGWYVVSPEQGSAALMVKTDTLRRGIFDVPVYAATARLTARFAPPPAPRGLPPGASVDWSQARVVLGFSDLRGAKADVAARLTTPAGGQGLAFAPASDIALGAPGIAEGVEQGRFARPAESFGLVSAPIAGLAGGGELTADLRFTGAQRLSVLPFAKSTRVTIAGDWPAPKFDGGFLPETRSLQGGRFQAAWSVPFMARGLNADGTQAAISLGALGQKDLGVSFVRTNNPYQNVIRALKYAVMFVGLVFLTFFVFEALSGRRVHPAQYVLIGLAQMVFYLLLLSLSEYVGFDAAFAVAAVATVGLIGAYAGAAFHARRYAIQALVVFSLIYALIYLLMRLEDFALLAGSVASFVGLALAMWLTRRLDWYGARAETAPREGSAT